MFETTEEKRKTKWNGKKVSSRAGKVERENEKRRNRKENRDKERMRK